MSPPRILIVEDDPSILLGLRMNLKGEGYEVGEASDGESGLRLARDQPWDVILLDVMLPKMNGYELVCALRAEGYRTPVLMISARTSDIDKIMGLDVGADDYITKPFAVGELLARVRAALRRREPNSEGEATWKLGDIVINPETREVHRSGVAVDLTVTEFEVLASLLRAKGRVLSRQQLMDMVWGTQHHGTPRTVDNFIAQLRSKLEEDPTEPLHLLTVRGVGYRIGSAVNC